MIKNLIESLKSLEGRVICLLLCLIPSFVHTAYVIIQNENINIPNYITIPTGVLFAFGFEATILVFTLVRNRYVWFRIIPYVFAGLQLWIHLEYSKNDILGKILSFSLVFSSLVYSDLIKMTDDDEKPKRKRKTKASKEVDEEEPIEELEEEYELPYPYVK